MIHTVLHCMSHSQMYCIELYHDSVLYCTVDSFTINTEHTVDYFIIRYSRIQYSTVCRYDYECLYCSITVRILIKKLRHQRC